MPKKFMFQVAGPGKELRVAFGERLFYFLRQAIGNFKQLMWINHDV